MMKHPEQSFSLEKVKFRFETEEIDKETIKSTFEFNPTSSRIKKVKVTLTFRRLFDADALSLEKLEIDKKTDARKIVAEIEEVLQKADLFCETIRHGDYLIWASHCFVNIGKPFPYYIKLKNLPGLELVLKNKGTSGSIYISSENKLYFRFSKREKQIKEHLKNKDYQKVKHELGAFGRDAILQENGEAYIEIGVYEDDKGFAIFQPDSSEATIHFHRLLGGEIYQGEDRFHWTLEEVLISPFISEAKRKEYRKKIDSKTFPIEVEQYIIYRDLFFGERKEKITIGDWVQMKDGCYKATNINFSCTGENSGFIDLRKAGGQPFFGSQFDATSSYSIIEKMNIRKLQEPFTCELTIKGQNGISLYGEAEFESDTCYFVKPYFIDDSNYFEAIAFMAKNHYEVNHYFDSITDEYDRQEAIFRIYQSLTDAPYLTIAVSKENIRHLEETELKGLDRLSSGYNVQEELCSLHFKNHEIPYHVLDNLIIKENIGDKELLTLAKMLADSPGKSLWKEKLIKNTENSVESSLRLYSVETYRVFLESLTESNFPILLSGGRDGTDENL